MIPPLDQPLAKYEQLDPKEEAFLLRAVYRPLGDIFAVPTGLSTGWMPVVDYWCLWRFHPRVLTVGPGGLWGRKPTTEERAWIVKRLRFYRELID